MDAQHTKHASYTLAYHFVWCPRISETHLDREDCRVGEQAIRRICDINTWTSLRAQCAGRSCASLSQRFPDRCSLTDCSHPERHHRPRVFQHFPARQETALGRCPSRSRSYYVGSVGDMSRASIVTYIQLGQDGSRERQKMEIPLALLLTGFTTPRSRAICWAVSHAVLSATSLLLIIFFHMDANQKSRSTLSR
jgi:putative transposase